MRRYKGDPSNKTLIRKMNNKEMPPMKKVKLEKGQYQVICIYIKH